MGLAASHMAAAVPGCNLSPASVLAHIHSIFPGLQQSKRNVRRVYLIGVVVVHMPNTNNERSLREPNLSGIVVQPQKRNPSLRSQPNRRGSHARR